MTDSPPSNGVPNRLSMVPPAVIPSSSSLPTAAHDLPSEVIDHLSSLPQDGPDLPPTSVDTANVSLSPATSQTILRRFGRVSQPPDRLSSATLWNPQSRLPRAYPAFPFPAKPVTPTFPVVPPDLGPDPQTYSEAVSSPGAHLWVQAIQ